MGKISASEASRAVSFPLPRLPSRLASHAGFSYAHTEFFLLFPTMRAWSQATESEARRYGSLTFNFHGDSSRPFQEENRPQENYFL